MPNYRKNLNFHGAMCRTPPHSQLPLPATNSQLPAAVCVPLIPAYLSYMPWFMGFRIA